MISLRIFFLLVYVLLIFLYPASAQNGNKPSYQDNKSESEIKLSLKDAIRITLKNNVSIAVEEFFVKIKNQQITQEESVFDPSVSAEISAERTDSQVASAFAFPNISQNENKNLEFSLSQKLQSGADYKLNFTNSKTDTNSAFAGLNPQYRSELSLTLTQPLLKNFGSSINRTNIVIASNNRDISNYEFQNKVIRTLSEVEDNYWNLVFSIQDLNVKMKSLERAQNLERRVRAQVEVGTLAPLEILQAQSEVASREQLLVLAKDIIQDNEDKLKNNMNINFQAFDAERPIDPLDKPEFQEKVDISLKDNIKKALENRPDYLAKKRNLENKNITLKFNENQIYPSLDLFATLGLNGIAGDAQTINQFNGSSSRSDFDGDFIATLDNMFDPEYYNFEIGVKLTYPIGNRSAKSKLTSSRLELQQSILDIKKLERTIIVEVRESTRQVQTDSKRVGAAKIARKFAEEKLKAEEKKFSVGMSTSFNVLQFQEDLAEEQRNEINSIIDYKKSSNRLNRVMGLTLEQYNIQLAQSNSAK